MPIITMTGALARRIRRLDKLQNTSLRTGKNLEAGKRAGYERLKLMQDAKQFFNDKGRSGNTRSKASRRLMRPENFDGGLRKSASPRRMRGMPMSSGAAGIATARITGTVALPRK